MLVLADKGKTIDVSLDPMFFNDLGQLIQIVFPQNLQTFVNKDGLVCILESNRKLLSLRNPVSGVFRAFNTPCESFPERYTPDQFLFTVQPMSKEEYDKERAEKLAKQAEKLSARVPPPPPEALRVPEPADNNWINVVDDFQFQAPPRAIRPVGVDGIAREQERIRAILAADRERMRMEAGFGVARTPRPDEFQGTIAGGGAPARRMPRPAPRRDR